MKLPKMVNFCHFFLMGGGGNVPMSPSYAATAGERLVAFKLFSQKLRGTSLYTK